MKNLILKSFFLGMLGLISTSATYAGPVTPTGLPGDEDIKWRFIAPTGCFQIESIGHWHWIFGSSHGVTHDLCYCKVENRPVCQSGYTQFVDDQSLAGRCEYYSRIVGAPCAVITTCCPPSKQLNSN